jgi:uncharacterized protein (TIGR03792 family)
MLLQHARRPRLDDNEIRSAAMVIEVLTFEVAPSDLAGWLAAEGSAWTPYLQGCDGFIRKEIWRDRAVPSVIEVVIWWETYEQWKQITAADVAAVDQGMGEWFRGSTCRELDRLS